MNKTIKVNNITYNIEVKLNHLIEKRINGKRRHKVIITSPNLKLPLEYLIEDIEKQLPLIEKDFDKLEKVYSKEEQILKELGYN